MRFETNTYLNPHKSAVEYARNNVNQWVVLYMNDNTRIVGLWANETAKPLDAVLTEIDRFGNPLGVTLAAPGYPMVAVVGYNPELGRWGLSDETFMMGQEEEAATTTESAVTEDPNRRVYWLVADEDQEHGVAHKVATTAQDAAEQYFDDNYYRDEEGVWSSIWVVREDDAQIFRFETERIECDCDEYELNVVQTR